MADVVCSKSGKLDRTLLVWCCVMVLPFCVGRLESRIFRSKSCFQPRPQFCLRGLRGPISDRQRCEISRGQLLSKQHPWDQGRCCPKEICQIGNQLRRIETP